MLTVMQHALLVFMTSNHGKLIAQVLAFIVICYSKYPTTAQPAKRGWSLIVVPVIYEQQQGVICFFSTQKHGKKQEGVTIFTSLVRAPLQHKWHFKTPAEFRQHSLPCFKQLHPGILVSSYPLIEDRKSPLFLLTRCLLHSSKMSFD